MVSNDGLRCAEVIRKTASFIDRATPFARFETLMQEIVSRHWLELTRDYEVARFALELFDAQRRCMIRGSTNFVMVIWSFVVFEGLIRRLDPDLGFSGGGPGGLFPPCLRKRKERGMLIVPPTMTALLKRNRAVLLDIAPRDISLETGDLSRLPAEILPLGLLRAPARPMRWAPNSGRMRFFARFCHPISIDRRPAFLQNPCEAVASTWSPAAGRTRNCRRQKHGPSHPKRSARRRRAGTADPNGGGAHGTAGPLRSDRRSGCLSDLHLNSSWWEK